jgi:biopolymer transport protein ExbD
LNVDINVTPLIDVLLVLLIIFMVIVPVTPRGLAAEVPQPPTSPYHNQDAAIVVQILSTSGGRQSYKINQHDVAIDDLGNRLAAIFSARANKVMFIKGDGTLDFSAVARVVHIGKEAGADRIGLITPKDGI